MVLIIRTDPNERREGREGSRVCPVKTLLLRLRVGVDEYQVTLARGDCTTSTSVVVVVVVSLYLCVCVCILIQSHHHPPPPRCVVGKINFAPDVAAFGRSSARSSWYVFLSISFRARERAEERPSFLSLSLSLTLSRYGLSCGCTQRRI